jgi:imidazoleglycerol-phosphate dehydratase
MARRAEVERITKETQIQIKLDLDGSGVHEIATGIPFFDHMLSLFSVHGFFDLVLTARGDIEVDFHHTIEDVGLVMGQALFEALGEKKGIVRYGYAVTPMDDALAKVAVDLSGRPYLVYDLPESMQPVSGFDAELIHEFFQAFTVKGAMNLHIEVSHGRNQHHILEAIFKAVARALDQATGRDSRVVGVRSSKGTL